MADFGKLLRSLREAAQVSMGALARHLEVSVTYISDVERGTRAPLSAERITKVAKFLKLSPEHEQELVAAAGAQKGFYELDIFNDEAREVGAALRRGWPNYSDAQFQKLKKVLEELEKMEDP